MTVLTTDSVEASPFFRIVIRTEWPPFARTILSCGGEPSRTCATSRIRIGDPLTTLIGTSLRSLITWGEALSRIGYWIVPIFDSPDGTTIFWAVIALVTSLGVNP